MRAILVALLLLAPAALASSPEARAQRVEDDLARAAYGALTASSADDPATIADRYLRDHAPDLGLPAGFTLEKTATKRSLAATHHRFQQTWAGLPVVGGDVSVHVLRDGTVFAAHSRAVPALAPGAANLPADAAVAAARAAAEGAPDAAARRVVFADGALGIPAWEVSLHQALPLSSPLVHVDARDGAILSVTNRVHEAVPGRVWINPIVESGLADLRDHRLNLEKFDDPTPNRVVGSRDFSEYLHEVDLEGLEDGPFGPILSGPRVRIVDALASGDDLRFAKEDPRFEEVMAYYWMNWTQARLVEHGFDDLMAYQIPVYAHDQNGLYNAFYRRSGDGTGEIHFGWHAPVVGSTGIPSPSVGVPGVPVTYTFADSAEDAEVVVHEYAHAVLDNASPNFNGGHMHEGFADFFAGTMLSRVSNGTFDWCIAEWFTSYRGVTSGGRPPCLRTLDNDLTTDYPGQGHALGQVWSGALWNIRNEMGRDAGEKLVLEAVHLLPTRASFPEGVEALLLADAALNGGANSRLIYEEFSARNVTGIVVTPEIVDFIVGKASATLGTQDTPAAAVPTAPLLALAAGALAVAAGRRRA